MKQITIALLLIAATHITGCKGLDSGGIFPWQQKSAKKQPNRHPLKIADSANKKSDDDADPTWDFGFKKEKELDEPVKMFVTWTESEYTQLGKPPIRGFTGRAYFYNKEYEAIKVDGELVVYGFDDTTQSQAKRTADRKCIFKADHLAGKFSKSHLGASYSLWVPWDEVGGNQKHISLLPVFRSSKGQIVRGEQIVNILHGKKNPAERRQEDGIAGDSDNRGEGIQQVAFNDPLAMPSSGPIGAAAQKNNTAAGTSMKTATINVPRSTMRHLRAPIASQTTLSPRRALEPNREPPTSGVQRREKSAHYIFDNNRAPIRPRNMRRGNLPSSESAQMSAVNYPAPAAPTQQQAIRSEPRIPQAPARPHVPPTLAPVPLPQYRGALPSALPTIQQSYPQPPLGGYSSDARSAGY